MENSWDTKYLLAKEYYEEKGNLLIPSNYSINGVNLGTWINYQRQLYNGNRKSKLTTVQIKKLNDIGMLWNVLDSNWMERYNLAKKYYIENNDLFVPENYISNNIRLDIWIKTQKQNYIRNKLSQKQINMLNEIGIIWDIYEFNWERNYKLAEAYFKEYGNLKIPIDYVINDIKLGGWIQTQRQAYKGRILSRFCQNKVSKLEKIGMIWKINKKDDYI